MADGEDESTLSRSVPRSQLPQFDKLGECVIVMAFDDVTKKVFGGARVSSRTNATAPGKVTGSATARPQHHTIASRLDIAAPLHRQLVRIGAEHGAHTAFRNELRTVDPAVSHQPARDTFRSAINHPPVMSGERKSRIVTLRVSPHRLQAVLESAAPSAPTKAEKPKKEKKEKKPPAPKEPKPPKAPKEPKKTKKQLQAEAAAAAAAASSQAQPPPQTPAAPPPAATPKPSGIKIKLNVNSLKNRQQESAPPQTPGTAKAAATLSTQALTPAPTQAPQITTARPQQLSNLPPIQTKVVRDSIPATTDPVTGTPSLPKIRIKASFSQPKPAADGTVKTPIIKLKSSASRPVAIKRSVPIGCGYDSEASDREEDPAIEEQFILRMPPGEDCDFLHAEIEKKDFGKSSDVWFKFKDDRRAIVCVRGRMYSATLVDLPCIIESNKTIDKGKNIFKTADISQMLLVGDRVILEDQALSNPTPSTLTNYPHGITPPMHWARRRRFRKRVVNRNMDKVEDAVDKLLAADQEADRAEFELLTEADIAREAAAATSSGDANAKGGYTDLGDEDAEGEEDVEYEDEDVDGGEHEEMDLMDFQDQLAEAMMLDDEHEPAPAKTNGQSKGLPPAAISSDEDEDDDDDDGSDGDGDAMDVDSGLSAEKLQLKEEISDLERIVTLKIKERDDVPNRIIKERLQKVIDGLNAELELKRRSLAETA
ncbi:Transcription initiation factor [Drechslerella dactyloides]|uniref:Transcription initiation factor n=1 Tax=Drechslerella dactyloides TaxID=74499 RepID=A0AAD6NGT8_DREDA|nr:Transcription initiation factor [Drechslerella dactyloides]